VLAILFRERRNGLSAVFTPFSGHGAQDGGKNVTK